jgi:putative ABC transport system ATP-binding protein
MTNSATSLLSLRDVTKTYPGQPPLTVLKNVTVDMGTGEDIAVVGPSGSGKTTMISIMGLLDHATSGDVWIDGIDAATLPEAERARLRAEAIGFVFQEFFLLPTLSALDNVAEGMLYQGLRRNQRRIRAMEALDRVGLSPRSGHRPGELSGGEKQRVAIARAMAGGPRLLFADEPTGALDQTSGHMIVDYLQAIAADGTTVVVITHDQGLARRFTRQISLLDGQITSDRLIGSGRGGDTAPEVLDE